jgi:hypothetical protein
MMELITIAAAQAITKIALDKFVEGGAGELGARRSPLKFSYNREAICPRTRCCR